MSTSVKRSYFPTLSERILYLNYFYQVVFLQTNKQHVSCTQ